MTIKGQPVRCISGISLMALFLVFLAVSAFAGGYEVEPDIDKLATRTAAMAGPTAFRKNTDPGYTPGLYLKAAGPCLLAALFGCPMAAGPTIRASALKVNIPRHNTFYVFVTTNAP